MTAQEIFDEFKYCFPDVGGWIDSGVERFLTGDLPSELQTERDGGARYPEVDEYLSQRNALSAPVDALSTVASGLQNDCAVGLDVGWRQNDDVNFTKYKGGRGVTVWGYYYDSAANASSPERYTDLIISCSDDAKTNYRWRTGLITTPEAGVT